MHSNFNPSCNGTPLAAGRPAKWTHFDPRQGAAYIHLHDSQNRIVRLDRRAELVSNGAAPRLEPTRTIRPIVFDPAIRPAAAVRDLKVLVADLLPVHPDQRWTVISWLLTAFFAGLVRQRALLRVAGAPESGKTTTAELLSCLLCGTGIAENGRPQEAAQAGDPLLIIEETRCKKSPDNLLLDLAQGTARSHSLALVTGRGDFECDELNLWAYRVDCSTEFQDPNFLGDTQLGDVIRYRRRIFSGLFQLFAREVVPGLDYRRAQILERIRQEHPCHCHNQLDSFLALMAVILEALLGALHGSGGPGEEAWRLISGWIEKRE